MRSAFLIFGLWLALLLAVHAETMPSKPEHYFNDYAGVVPASTAEQLDGKLRQFERDSSNQIVVAVFKKLETNSSLEDYCQRVFESWKVGQAKLNNGAVLFVFVQDHKMRIQTGYGLEGALPDITCSQIIRNEIAPAFKAGQYGAGLSAGVEAMIKATRGEYHGTGKVHGDDNGSIGAILVLAFVVIYIVMIIVGWSRRGTAYTSGGRRTSSWGGGGFWMGGGGSGGGFGGGDSGGGFSGGGGDSGGGGASGSW